MSEHETKEEAVAEILEAVVATPTTWSCGYCGCPDPPIEGDEVHPGYDGWPICPSCGGC